MLRFGRELNPTWDDERAKRHLDQFLIPLDARIGNLSGGQQAQVALTVCLAKRPEILLLDEPVAALDPLARENVMHLLLRSVIDDGIAVLLSSHAVSDLAAICDHGVILSGSQLQLVESLEDMLMGHRLVIGVANTAFIAPEGSTLIASLTTGRQTTSLVRTDRPLDFVATEILEPTLEEIVIAYLRQERPTATTQPDKSRFGNALATPQGSDLP